jgi:hypothetical protein
MARKLRLVQSLGQKEGSCMRNRDDLHVEVPLTVTVYVMFQLHKQKDGSYLADGQSIEKKGTKQTFPLRGHVFNTVEDAKQEILDQAKKQFADSSWRTSWRGLLGLNVILMTMGLLLLVVSHSSKLQMLLTGRPHRPEPLTGPLMIILLGLLGAPSPSQAEIR